MQNNLHSSRDKCVVASEGLKVGQFVGSDSEVEQAEGARFTAHKNGDSQCKDSKNAIQLYTRFEDMGLKEKILRGIFAYGYEKPSMIQQQAIVPCLQGGDMVMQSQSGTGKTATFAIAVLQKFDTTVDDCQALVLSPTRDLARQTHLVFITLGDYLNANIHLLVGGESIGATRQKLRTSAQIVVGTPGRVKHMLLEGMISPRHIKMFVLDEVDVMLSHGFEEQVREIYQKLPREVQCISVSATLPPVAIKVMEKFMINPLKILVPPEKVSLEAIQQFYVDVEEEGNKFETLCDIYETLSVPQSVIFCNTKRKVECLTNYMEDQSFTVSCIHGEQSTEERKMILKAFRSGSSRVLIATDVLQRGIDVHHVALVCNIDLPWEKESYIHRIGRCGRFGRKGVAISLVTKKDFANLKALEMEYAIKINEMPMDVANYM